jgi:hypothetical protein
VTDSEYAWESFLAVIDVSKRMEFIDKLMKKVETNG